MDCLHEAARLPFLPLDFVAVPHGPFVRLIPLEPSGTDLTDTRNLSFDGSMLAYLKSHSYADSYVAGMRGVGVVSGLLGTMAMPLLETRIGLVRAGTWSILCVSILSLSPSLFPFPFPPFGLTRRKTSQFRSHLPHSGPPSVLRWRSSNR
jgi:hypothetical protein